MSKRVLSLDLSTKTGWAVLDAVRPGCIELVDYGQIKLDRKILDCGNGTYPWNYQAAAQEIAGQVKDLLFLFDPKEVVIEEVNLGKSRWAQKALAEIHSEVLRVLAVHYNKSNVTYLDTSSWRRALGLKLSKEDRKNNRTLKEATSVASTLGKRLDKKELGIKGKVTWKHLSVAFANKTYNLTLKVANNDIADAICIGIAFLQGAIPCDGR